MCRETQPPCLTTARYMSYIVLARKLRPVRFDDLVGQETIAQILKNAISTNRIGHAFLFTGSRGVGKTTAARVLTKAINCLNPQEVNPCEKCQTCLDITNNASPDVYEIDAASNRGIDNIRELRENIKYAPANCRYKVYIIDEAHMLTLESFNALLKTLEEPPAHVKFILATTDPHKLPQTIISRCQRYDFVRIPLQKMVDYLSRVIKEEGIMLSRDALQLVAQQAVGGMRDALTMIDQITSYSGLSATDEEVSRILGLVDTKVRFQLLKALLAKDSTTAMAKFHEMQQRGHNFQDILSNLLQSVKNLSLIHTFTQQTGQLPPTLFQEIPEEDVKHYKSFVPAVSLDELQQMFRVLMELEEQIKQSSHAQICFEMAIIQLTSVQALVGIPELLQQVKGLREGTSNNHGTKSESKPTPPRKYSRGPSSTPNVPTSKQEHSAISGERSGEKKELPVQNVSEVPPSSLQTPTKEWEAFVESIQQKSPWLGSVLKNAVLVESNEKRIQIAFKESQFKEMLTNEKMMKLREFAKDFYCRDVEINVQDDNRVENSLTISEQRQRLSEEKRDRRLKAAKQDERVQMILKKFPGSKIVDFQIQEPEL